MAKLLLFYKLLSHIKPYSITKQCKSKQYNTFFNVNKNQSTQSLKNCIIKLYNRFLKRWTSVSRCLRARERTSETFSATSCLSVSPLDRPQIGYGSLPLSRNIYTDLGSALHGWTCSNKSAFTRILSEFQDHCNINFLVFCLNIRHGL